MTLLVLIALALNCVNLVLHVVAPFTKTKVDDRLAELTEQGVKILPAPQAPAQK